MGKKTIYGSSDLLFTPQLVIRLYCALGQEQGERALATP